MVRPFLPVCVGLLLAAFSLRAAAPPSAIDAANLDFAASKLLDPDAEAPLEEAAVLDLLGLGGAAKSGKPEKRGKEAPSATYLLAFKQPVAIGTVLGAAREVRVLKPDAAWPPNPATNADWETVKVPASQSPPSFTALPPKLKTRALIVTIPVPPNGSPSLRLITPRYVNQTPLAVANADEEWTTEPYLSAPYKYDAGHITRGYGNWINSGKGSDGINSRAPITDVAPSWFLLSWTDKQRFSGIVLQDNFEKFELQSYEGPAGINPAAATEAEWRTLRKFSETRVGGQRWITFDPIETRALRVKITKTAKEPAVAKLAGFHTLTDIGDEPAKPMEKAAGETPPFEITYDLPKAGQVTIVVETEKGTRVRNLFANVEREAGPNAQPWDLKDEAGNYVAPGKYRWRAITHPPLELRYQLTAYPNVTSYFPERPAWLTGHNGSGGWMADHSAPVAACTTGDRVFLGSPVAESGVALIETDLEGRKVWGFHSFEAWTGAGMLATDGVDLFNVVSKPDVDKIWAIDLKSMNVRPVASLPSTASRKRGVRGIAARDGQIYLAVNATDDWLNNAVSVDDVDLANSTPAYPTARPPRAAHEVVADPRTDFLRLLRLRGQPPGQGNIGLIYLETTSNVDREQNIVVAFKKPVAIGSLVLPLPPKEDKVQFTISVLKPGSAYPPRLSESDDWQTVPFTEQGSWAVIPLPAETLTQALRFTFTQGGEGTASDDLLSVVEKKADGPSLDLLDEPKKPQAGLGTPSGAWQRKLEGLKLLGRRYENLFPSAKVVVSSGTVAKDGTWDAQRKEPISAADPAVYAMEWQTPQSIRGLAIKEIDGAETQIDAYTGPANGPIDIKGDANWEKVGTYKQALRNYYQPDDTHNSRARYLDGYVDFGRNVETRALRLRIVKPWDTQPDRPAGVRFDQGAQTLDLTRGHVYGVAPLKYLGGEPRQSPLATDRLEILDAKSGKIIKELPLPGAGSSKGAGQRGNILALGPKGDLYAISEGKLVRINPNDGTTTVLAEDLLAPTTLAAGPDGNLYVFDADKKRKTIRVYDSAGKFLREIGEPGGYSIGKWNPNRMDAISALAVDKLNQVWAVDRSIWPKRISLWDQDGKFQKEFLGPTEYGGGGTIDPGDPRQMFYGPLEFEVDWDKGTTRLKNLTSADGKDTGDVPVRINDRLYLTNVRPRDFGTTSANLYLHDGDRARLVSIVGVMGEHPILRDPELTKALGGKVLLNYLGVWSDLNGDEKAQPDEVQLWPREDARVQVLFDSKLNAQIGPIGFRVKEWLPNGAPVYERVDNSKIWKGMTLPLDNGNYYHFEEPTHDNQIAGLAPDGTVIWSYPTEGAGVHALTRSKPMYPGQIVCMIGLAGHTTAHAGDLGEFVVFNTNTGVLDLMTADGLFAGQIFSDLRARGTKPWSMPETNRGMELKNTSMGQEHFNAYFTKTADNRYFVVAGHNHASVVEVIGMDKFKRFGGEIEITAKELKETQEWEHLIEQQRVYAKAPVIDAHRVTAPPKLDGKLTDWPESASAQIDDQAKFRIGYDDQFLYVAYEIQGRGPLKNQGRQWDRLFKSGAAVDLLIGTDPAAPADRKIPVKGDQRLLMTFMGDEPAAVLYEAVVPGTAPDKAWQVVSPVGKATFDRVRKLDDVRLFASGDANQYVVEAAIPLKELGLTITPGLRVKMDWGMLVSGPDGTEVQQREYWANKFTHEVSDAPTEAVLHPDLWGHIRFQEKTADAHLDPGEKKPDEGLKDLLDDLK